jgi:hypothetical protein
MLQLVADNHLSDIGSLYWEKLQHHVPCRILRMSIHSASTIVSFTSWLIDIPIGCKHPLIDYWQSLLAITTAKSSVRDCQNDGQPSVNSFSCCILGNQGIARIFAFITELLTASTCKKYNISKVKHQLQINPYCKLQSMRKHINGC